MKRNIRVVTFGCGVMGRYITRYMKERGGFDQVAASNVYFSQSIFNISF